MNVIGYLRVSKQAIDVGIDTTTPTGQLVVNIMASVNQ